MSIVAEPGKERAVKTDEPTADSPPPRRHRLARTVLFAHGEPLVWLTGGALATALAMIVGLLCLVMVEGFSTFWPRRILAVQTADGKTALGEVSRVERIQGNSDGPVARRTLLRTGNFDLTGTHYTWVNDSDVLTRDYPASAVIIERMAWGRFYGTPVRLTIQGEVVAEGKDDVLRAFHDHHAESRRRWNEEQEQRRTASSRNSRRQEEARLALRAVELREGVNSAAYQEAKERFAVIEAESHRHFEEIQTRNRSVNEENERNHVTVQTADGKEKTIPLNEIVRMFAPNSLSLSDKIGVYLSRWNEFLTDNPREANSEGGVYPAIFGTLVMTLIMTIVVVPFGVLAALYLREYARGGAAVSIIRVAINNLAGVPSIVYGVFGLGFFCYILGGGIDQLFFSERLPSPTFGKGGLIWASFTLALLTLPVVIVATEEALAAVPKSMREGSYACGASKWQTIRRIVLPRALPGIMTGMILAMARGAGEVAPLMLVGAVKLAPELPVDGEFPYLHPQRSFMHLGFHIFDLGFQSQNSEAAIPMVFTTTLLLITIVAILNLMAVWIRTQLRKRYASSQF